MEARPAFAVANSDGSASWKLAESKTLTAFYARHLVLPGTVLFRVMERNRGSVRRKLRKRRIG